MNILEGTQYIITIPTDPIELAILLDNYSCDPGIVLAFLDTVASRMGITLDAQEVRRVLHDMYKE